MTTRLRLAIAAIISSLAATMPASAEGCEHGSAVLGTSRTLTVDPRQFTKVGTLQYQETIPLADHEVVLTFDDGPWPATTPRVLEALARECVHATFFLIGKPASEHPEQVRQIAAAGHTIGHHTWTHHNLKYMSAEDAEGEIDKGIAAVEMALRGTATTTPATPFFRFPHFETTPLTLEHLQQRGIVVFSADISGNDWDPMTPAQELQLLTDRLKAAGKGIILLHDPEEHTAAMLPDFLRYLRENGYRIVHLVPAANASAAR